MSVTSYQPEGRPNELVMTITDRFDFTSHQAFRSAYAGVDPLRTHFIIDLSNAQYIDSSALGMLLVLRERAGGDEAHITLKSPTSDIRKVLGVARFEQLFRIE